LNAWEIIELCFYLYKEGAETIYALPYGRDAVSFSLPANQTCDWITYQMDDGLNCDKKERSAQVVRQALASPTGTSKLSQLACGRKKAVIVISDGTRLCPSELLLPALLEELNAGGIPDNAIDIVIALGLHRKQTKEEMICLVGAPVFRRIRVHNHSAEPEDCVRLGRTSSGTPVEINRLVAEADLRIVTGNIEPHAMAGISGGMKSIVPGTASRRCIEHNHGLSLQDRVKLGEPDNRVHTDIEEALRFISVDFMLNVVVNHRREVLEAVAGHIIDAHRAGVRLASERFIVPVGRSYDLTLVSPGGYPKDMQMYQSLKALRNASKITKNGGAIIMAAACQEIFGNGIFQYWVETMKDRQRTVSKLNREFVLGAHKITHLDEVLSKQRVYLLSEIPEPIVRLLGMEPVADLQSTLEQILDQARGKPTIACMPYGSLTFPSLS